MAANKTIASDTTTVPVTTTQATKQHSGVHYVKREHRSELGFIGHFAEGGAYLLWAIKHPVLAFGNSAGFFGIGLAGFAVLMLLLGVLFGGKSNTGNAFVDAPSNAGSAINDATSAPIDNIRQQRQNGSSNFGNGLVPPSPSAGQ